MYHLVKIIGGILTLFLVIIMVVGERAAEGSALAILSALAWGFVMPLWAIVFAVHSVIYIKHLIARGGRRGPWWRWPFGF